MPDQKRPPLGESPTYLIAAAYAGHMVGDKELERVARQRLVDDYGIKLNFFDPSKSRTQSAERKGGAQNG